MQGQIPESENRPQRRKWQLAPVLLPGEFHDRGAWRATVHGVAKSWIQLSEHAMEEGLGCLTWGGRKVLLSRREMEHRIGK